MLGGHTAQSHLGSNNPFPRWAIKLASTQLLDFFSPARWLWNYTFFNLRHEPLSAPGTHLRIYFLEISFCFPWGLHLLVNMAFNARQQMCRDDLQSERGPEHISGPLLSSLCQMLDTFTSRRSLTQTFFCFPVSLPLSVQCKFISAT